MICQSVRRTMETAHTRCIAGVSPANPFGVQRNDKRACAARFTAPASATFAGPKAVGHTAGSDWQLLASNILFYNILTPTRSNNVHYPHMRMDIDYSLYSYLLITGAECEVSVMEAR